MSVPPLKLFENMDHKIAPNILFLNRALTHDQSKIYDGFVTVRFRSRRDRIIHYIKNIGVFCRLVRILRRIGIIRKKVITVDFPTESTGYICVSEEEKIK